MTPDFSPNKSSVTSNTKVHVHIYRKCAVIGCKVEGDLVRVGTIYHGLTAEFHICQKHLGGKK